MARDAKDKALAEIAKRHLHLETLETRKSDSLDFSDQSVWGIKAALEAAYQAGADARAELEAQVDSVVIRRAKTKRVR